jgi:hypothetical protein
LVSGIASISWTTCSGSEPLRPGTPRTLGICPMMIVIASPKMKPVTTDLARKSEMKPSRAMPAATSMTPTVRASAAVRAT